MTVENISWSISTKECCRPRRGLNPRPPGLQSDGASNWATEAGDPLDKASFLHTVRSVKDLNRMCCCSRTVYSALDSPAIDGKYDQGMLLSECAGAYWPESSLVTQDVLLHPVIIGGVLTISEGSDQTTEICWFAVSECAGWSVSSYKFYCRFCHAQTHARVVCANLNAKHPGYNFQQTTFWNIFLILPREHYLHFMQIVSTAWNVKSCFLGNEKKKKKKKTNSICRLLN